MGSTIAGDLEMACEAGFLKHGRRVPAYQNWLARGEGVVIIQHKGVGQVLHRPPVAGYLTVILAAIFQTRKFEGPDRDGTELRHADFRRNGRIANG